MTLGSRRYHESSFRIFESSNVFPFSKKYSQFLSFTSVWVQFREKLAQAYDFALEKVGMDFNSFPIWHEYVNFLKSVSAPGSYAENQKITAVRKVYQNAIVTPMFGIETLWKEYMSYEQSINKILSEKIIIDRSKDYMNARRVAKELEVMTKGVLKNAPAVLPTGTPEEIKQVKMLTEFGLVTDRSYVLQYLNS